MNSRVSVLKLLFTVLHNNRVNLMFIVLERDLIYSDLAMIGLASLRLHF